MEQQIHIAVSEAIYRSEQERINFRITEFYIVPGITALIFIAADSEEEKPKSSKMGFAYFFLIFSFVFI